MKLKERYLEIDIIRGFFIVCVVIFHFLWDLNFFFNLNINLYSPIGTFFQRLGAGTFFLLVGISTVIQKNLKGSQYSFKTSLFRGGKILSLAIAISIIVHFAYPQNNIIFGVLHSLGICSILVFPFIEKKMVALLVGVSILFATKYVHSYFIASKLLLPFGVRHYGFRSVDYFPLFPWFGVSLIGVSLGNVLYIKRKKEDLLVKVNNFLHKKNANIFLKFFITAGQKSAFIYILHQPFLYGICYVAYIILNKKG